ncbi:MAG: BlaI/MecI/CopY family transcriptional regulator [Acidobacteria bacterium]|nr:BlaI/MecI/CopY family transcriptional regulator [Acidobacteriota bacterium]
MKKELDSILLTRQELNIMKIVWDRGIASIKEVKEAMSSKKTVAYTTVLTLMGILERKGVVTHTKSSKAFIYRPLLSRQQAMRNHVRDMLAHYFDGDAEALIDFVLRNEVDSSDQLAAIRSHLQMTAETEKQIPESADEEKQEYRAVV